MKNFGIILLVWIIFLLQYKGILNGDDFTISKKNGLWSVFTGVFFHNSFSHLINNTVALLMTIPIVNYFYKKSFFLLIVLGLFIPSVLTYFLYPLSVVGISGLCYTLIWFVIAAGILSKDKYKLIMSLILLTMYGNSLVLAVPPQNVMSMGIAWKTHLYGTLIGIIYAVSTRK